MKKSIPVLWTLSALVLAASIIPAAAATEVGRYHPVSIDSARPYHGSPDGASTLVWEHTIHHPGATFIAVHFKDFQLAPGDFLQVADARGGQAYTLAGQGKLDLGEFWARHVKGDTAVLQLFATGRSGGPGFVIDTYSAGFLPIGFAEEPGAFDDPVSPLSTCGVSNFENATCYLGTTEYSRARAVARLLIRGRTLCTGWLVSDEGHFITNAHCIDTSLEWNNTDYEFGAEAPLCTSANGQMLWPGTIYEQVEFVTLNASKDYILLRFTSGTPQATFGYLQIDDRTAVVGEQIYIPGHPLGYAKMFGIKSDQDSGGVCRVATTTATACTGSTAYRDVGYYCDSEGGSSGSPVLATSSHKVIALHHCGTCPNRGVPISEIYPEIMGYLPDEGPECTENSQCDDGLFCNGVEACVAESCVSGSDPCPGQQCDEGGDYCYSCGDFTCDAGEDECNCPSDCGAPPSTEIDCDDGLDEDCDLSEDCADPDCVADPACASTCLEYGEPCTANAECCSNWCWWRGGFCR